MFQKKSGHQFRCERKRKLEIQEEVVKKIKKIDSFFNKNCPNIDLNVSSNTLNEEFQNRDTSQTISEEPAYELGTVVLICVISSLFFKINFYFHIIN